jgi:hypothetical protein
MLSSLSDQVQNSGGKQKKKSDVQSNRAAKQKEEHP